MALNPIEQNYNFLNLTGKSRGVSGVGYHPYVQPTGGEPAGQEGGLPKGRAVDNAPRAEMVNYSEYLPAQAGYRGYSTKFIIV